jgi:hypothetical protein
MSLTEEELKLLKELKAAGTRGRTISAGKPHDGLKSLVKAGYATAHGAGLDRVLYLITERAVKRHWRPRNKRVARQVRATRMRHMRLI